MGQVYIVAGLGFGDEGKGTVVDWLVRRRHAHTVVRYNGGAQAGHNVVTDDDRHHTFAQFGAGTFAGAATHLSRHVLIDPIALLAEARHLVALGVSDPFATLTVDGAALLVTPFHVAANRLRELHRGGGRHGSCGMGIGETRADHLRRGDAVPFIRNLLDEHTLRDKLAGVRADKLADLAALLAATSDSEHIARERFILEADDTLDRTLDVYRAFRNTRATIVDGGYLDDLLSTQHSLVFEGAQGVLLDEWYGFHPYTTWTDTTFANALALVDRRATVTRIGVLRTYHTRHGAGPFPSENDGLTHAEPHNVFTPWQRDFRAGHFDAVLARYALAVTGGADELALTHADRTPSHLCVSYDGIADRELYAGDRLIVRPAPDLAHQERLTRATPGARPRLLAASIGEWIESNLGVPITLVSRGPRPRDKREHRM